MKSQQNNQHHHHKPKLFEGLRAGDLQDMISPILSIDQFKSKMGEDKNVVVVSFKTKEKMPAIDLMEFIEKGYKFVLDADMSTGEERDGRYSVFVELERTSEVPKQILEMLNGIGQLANCKDWSFRYFKDSNLYETTVENLSQFIPLDEQLYASKMQTLKQDKVTNFFDQGSVDVAISENNTLTFTRPYSGPIDAKLLAIGSYEEIKNKLQGKISLDETSQSQVVFLTKFLGNYDIEKIADKFLIRNGNSAVIIEKDRW
jgi:hypothetical protein